MLVQRPVVLLERLRGSLLLLLGLLENGSRVTTQSLQMGYLLFVPLIQTNRLHREILESLQSLNVGQTVRTEAQKALAALSGLFGQLPPLALVCGTGGSGSSQFRLEPLPLVSRF